MDASENALFTPMSIGELEIAGRLVKTATSETRATAEGFATEQTIEFYEPMARGGVPLIITGNIYTSRDGQSTPFQMGVDSDDKIPALAALTEAVHRHGSKIVAQLSHCGRQVLPPFVGLDEAVSASAVKDLSTGTKPRPLTVEEIERIVVEFGEAAARCEKAGFDGVQIHAGHGYLISQFLTPYTNRRRDAYGGTAEKRMRLLRDVHRAIRERTSPKFAVILKLNGDDYLPLRPGLGPGEIAEIARTLEEDGVDGVEISVGHYESGFPVVRGTFGRCLKGMVEGSARHLPTWRRILISIFWPLGALLFNILFKPYPGYNTPYARRVKSRLSIPVICVGGFVTREEMGAAIERGDCDAVSAGRAFIADPYLYGHLRDGKQGPRCVQCNACVGHIGTRALDCYHPDVRREKDAMLASTTATASAPAPDRAA